MVVKTLPAVGYEGPKISRINRLAARPDNDEHFAVLQRYECLAPQRVPLHDVDLQRQRGRRSAAGNAHTDAAALRYIDITQIIEALETCLGKTAEKNMLPLQAGDVQETWCDISALAQATGYQPSTDLDQGIAAFVAWYRAYRAGSRATDLL